MKNNKLIVTLKIALLLSFFTSGKSFSSENLSDVLTERTDGRELVCSNAFSCQQILQYARGSGFISMEIEYDPKTKYNPTHSIVRTARTVMDDFEDELIEHSRRSAAALAPDGEDGDVDMDTGAHVMEWLKRSEAMIEIPYNVDTISGRLTFRLLSSPFKPRRESPAKRLRITSEVPANINILLSKLQYWAERTVIDQYKRGRDIHHLKGKVRDLTAQKAKLDRETAKPPMSDAAKMMFM